MSPKPKPDIKPYQDSVKALGRCNGVFEFRQAMRALDDTNMVDWVAGSKDHIELCNFVNETHQKRCISEGKSFVPIYTFELHNEDPYRFYAHMHYESGSDLIRVCSIKLIFVLDDDARGYHVKSFDKHFDVSTGHFVVVRTALAGPKWRPYYTWCAEFFEELEDRRLDAERLHGENNVHYRMFLNENELMIIEMQATK